MILFSFLFIDNDGSQLWTEKRSKTYKTSKIKYNNKK